MKIVIFAAFVLLAFVIMTGCKHDSQDLISLQKALNSSFEPVTVKTQKGLVTSFDKVDENQQKALSIIMTSKSPDITPWLKEHVWEYYPIYLYALSYRLAVVDKAPAKDFVFWSSLANLRGSADRVLCKDKYVGQYLTILGLDLIQPAVLSYGKEIKQVLQDKEQLTEIMKEAHKLDKEHPQNNSPVWICSSGHGVHTEETYPQEEWETRRAEFKKQYTASLYK